MTRNCYINRISILRMDYTCRFCSLLRKADVGPSLNSGLPLVDKLCQRSITDNRFLQGVKTVRLWRIKWVNVVACRWLSFDTVCEKRTGPSTRIRGETRP